MRNLPFARSIRFNNWIRRRDIEQKKRLQRIKKSIEAYIYIYENEFFYTKCLLLRKNYRQQRIYKRFKMVITRT